jgi:hypothetical protein
MSNVIKCLYDEIGIIHLNKFRNAIIQIEDVNIVADYYTSYLKQAIDRCLQKKPIKANITNNYGNAPWFDMECKNARKLAVDMCKNHSNETIMQDACKHYTNLKQKKKRDYEKDVITYLENMQSACPKQFWKTINAVGKANNKQPNPYTITDELNRNKHIDNASFDTEFENNVK